MKKDILTIVSKDRKDAGVCMVHKNTGNYKKVVEVRIRGGPVLRLCTQHTEELIKKLKYELDHGRIW